MNQTNVLQAVVPISISLVRNFIDVEPPGLHMHQSHLIDRTSLLRIPITTYVRM